MVESITIAKEELEKLKVQVNGLTDQLADMQNYTEAIIDTTDNSLLILDNDLKVVSASRGFYNKFDTAEEAVINHYFYDLKNFLWNDPLLAQKLSETVAAKESSFVGYEITCSSLDKKKRKVIINAQCVARSHEKNSIIITIIEVINTSDAENYFAEGKQLNEERIKLAVESADIGTWEMDPATGKILCDKKCLQLLRASEKITNYKNFLNALHPDDRHMADNAIQEVITGTHNKKHIIIEYRTKFENENDRKWLKASGRVYFDAAGKAIHFAGTVLDITQQKLNEQLLKESEERFRLASDAAAAMIWLSSTDKMCNYFNKSWLQFTGNTFEQEKGNGWMKGIHPDDVGRYMDIYLENFDARKEFYMEYRLRRHDMEYRWISDSGMPRFSPEGIFEGYIGTCIDIHQQKMTQAELEKLVAERTRLLSDAINNLETSNTNLEEFAYVASHDLQEPLRKIQTFAHRLEEKNGEYLSNDTKLYLSKITQASGRMSRLIGDLLNYSRLHTTDPAEKIDLNEILANVLTDFDMLILEKKATVHVGKLPAVKAVSMRMNQLFHNLVSNALKFSKPSNPPVLDIYAEILSEELKNKYAPLKKHQQYIMITFADNGIGFQEEFSEKIFNIFQRLNGVGEYEGTGIGLAICKKIVTNHQGIIFAESKENEGTSFRIILPVS